MASQPPPESVIFGQFTGMKNTVASERLTQGELERALNIDIDDAGQVRRRRGFTLKTAGVFHSLFNFRNRVYGVKDNSLGIIRSDFSFFPLTPVSSQPISYTEVQDLIYYSSLTHSGTINNETPGQWGAVVDGLWYSPVIDVTATLGDVEGKLLGNPLKAEFVESYKGRIYMARGKTIWATELFEYNYVDRTKNFMQFEDDITLLEAVDDGIYVGTTQGLYFLKGVLGNMELSLVVSAPVLRGSGVLVPVEKVHPNARTAPLPTGDAVVLMTGEGICACLQGGVVFNLTQGAMVFPGATSVATLFRQQDGGNTFVAVTESGGTPVAKARIGDYADAEIRRAI